ncbi:MAG: glycosyltransferase family 4 protein [Longimicrobiales bacterium]
MNVLHIDGARRWGGGQNQVRLLMQGLARCNVRQLCVCPRGSPLETRLHSLHMPVAGIAWPRGADPRVMAHLFRRSRDVDLIHCHDAHALQLALLPARLRHIPVIATRRVLFRTSPGKWNRATRVIAISDPVRDRLVNSGVRADRIRMIPSGIDVEEVAALPFASPGLRDRLSISNDRFLAGNIGTLLDFKHQRLIPHAAAHARDIMWVIVGDGPERANLEEAIKSHGVTANVWLTGGVSDARLYLREMDAFVFPSKGEALGTSILDAMAMGVPVVAADDGGPAQVLAPVHAQTGVNLFPLDHAAVLAAHVRRLRDDLPLRHRVAALQRERVLEFGIARTVEGTLELYRELVEE